ncbi:phage baseplate protein [Leucobacter salsicius]|uniref:phage baseplate protein n=1 Tax=Leucobacter salsicius TaxID=664638 RepID=UPI000347CFF5|nr:hypothetical protein [Leucobacter salsicius]
MQVQITGVVADSAGLRESGRIEFAQAQRIDTGEMLITQSLAVAQVVNGALRQLDGTAFSLPSNPDGTAVRVREILGGRTFEWWTAIPVTDQVEYRSLPVVESTSVPSSVFGPPPWLADVNQMRDETVQAIEAGLEAADALGGITGINAAVDRAESASSAAADSSATATAEAERAKAAAESIDVDAIDASIDEVREIAAGAIQAPEPSPNDETLLMYSGAFGEYQPVSLGDGLEAVSGEIRVINNLLPNIDWTELVYAPGYIGGTGGTARVCRFDGVIYFEGGVQAPAGETIPAGQTIVVPWANIPTWARPARTVMFGARATGNRIASMSLSVGGASPGLTVLPNRNDNTSLPQWMGGSASWVAPGQPEGGPKLGANGHSVAFDLRQARVSFGAAFGSDDRYVMQGAFLCEAENNRWFTSRNTPGSESGRESAVVSMLEHSGSTLLNDTGIPVNSMVLIDAGHGDGAFIERTSSGQMFLWSDWRDWRYPSSDTARHRNIVRMPWAPGVYTFAQMEQYRVSSLSGVARRLNYDERNGVIVSREGGGATRTMNAFLIGDVKSSQTAPAPIASAVVEMSTVHGSVQNHAYMHETGKWFFLFGSPSGPAAVVSYNADGSTDFVKELGDAISYDAWGVELSVHEPEGIVVHHSPSGDASLIVGVATGPTHARKSMLYSIDMGAKSAAFDMLSNQLAPDMSTWNDYTTTSISLGAGFTSPSARPFRVSIENRKVRLRGRVEGPFAGPSVEFGKLNGTFAPVRHQQALCVAQLSNPNAISVLRLEVSVTGDMKVYIPDDNVPGWIDFDVSEFYLND